VSRRGRKRARSRQPGVHAPEPRPERAPPAPSRSELKDAEARAKLEPLREGERPAAVTAAAIIAFVLAVTEIVLAAAGYKVGGHRPAWPGVVVFTVLLLTMAWGLWRARYWAVLGMEALLGLTMIIFALALPFAGNLRAVLLSIGVLVPSGLLFWFLVKAMARIQMPERR
jgi:hypothetical protein